MHTNKFHFFFYKIHCRRYEFSSFFPTRAQTNNNASDPMCEIKPAVEIDLISVSR